MTKETKPLDIDLSLKKNNVDEFFNNLSENPNGFKNKDFRVFLGQDIIYFFGLAMFQTGLPFFVTSLLQLPESWTTYMFGGLTLLSLAFYPFVTKMAAKWGKKKLLIAAFIGFVLTFGFTALSGEKLSFIPIYVQAVIIVVLGSFPQAIFGIIPQTIIADIALSDERTSGSAVFGLHTVKLIILTLHQQCCAGRKFSVLISRPPGIIIHISVLSKHYPTGI